MACGVHSCEENCRRRLTMAKQRVALVCVPLTLVGLYLLNIGSPSSQADAAPAGRGGKRRGRSGGRGGRRRQ